jgi:hypothetical protein
VRRDCECHQGFLWIVRVAERPVDVHFKLFQVLPDAPQLDLWRYLLGCDYESMPTGRNHPLRLEVGAEVSFDLSVHGMIHHRSTMPPPPSPNGETTSTTTGTTKDTRNRSRQSKQYITPIQSARYDKGSLSAELKKDGPPGVGDKVVFELVVVLNMRMVERNR